MRLYPNPKINIGLYVVAERPDGFHNIETVFYPVKDIVDVIEMDRIASGVDFEVTNSKPICALEDNLCVKAFRLLQKECKFDGGVRIRLEKNIPMGGGLGGGSTDAAAVLKAVNQLYQLNLTLDELRQYAVRLGSDVPFFIDNIPAMGKGKGEILSPIPLDLSNKKISLIVPPFSMSTAEAYRILKSKPAPVDLSLLPQIPISEWKDKISNDFEQPLFIKFPILKKLKHFLYDIGAEYVSLSGSGSTVYAIGDEHYSVPSDFFNC
ncbi:MAG: 4-(cytidine 5'-diphospho)-2-C-methyl-D-erythritol kinase [Bacteroidales bacterium]|nr:4-(cytidine 5'-diphospho)-2-C-methyl-D-erythritol kinase [Bacteroidales bacterium]